jgi:hypothetical protein
MFPRTQVNHNYQEQEHIYKKEYREVKMNIDIDNKFDQIFKEQLHSYEEMPPESVWENIQSSGLNTSAAKSSNWKWWAAASVLAILLSTSAYVYNYNKSSEALELNDVNQVSKDSEPFKANYKSNINHQEKATEVAPQEAIITEERDLDLNETRENRFTDETIDETVIADVNQMIFEETVTEEEILIKEDNEYLSETIAELPKEINSIENQAINNEGFSPGKIEEKNDDTNWKSEKDCV